MYVPFLPTIGYNFITISLLTLYFTADTEETESTVTDVPIFKDEELHQREGVPDGNDISAQEEDVGK